MAKRQNIVEVDSSEVQGEGSYVVIRRQTVKEMGVFLSSDLWKELRKTLKDNESGGGVVIDIAREASERILKWDWVDDDGKELPLPKDDPSVFDQLTDREFMLLSNALGSQQSEEQKN